jgi:hypothetical protein
MRLDNLLGFATARGVGKRGRGVVKCGWAERQIKPATIVERVYEGRVPSSPWAIPHISICN